jgi:hypothetical protein
MEQCKDCKYWKATTNPWNICMRFPPITEETQIVKHQGIWPNTHFSSWCGEFQLIYRPAIEPHAIICQRCGCEIKADQAKEHDPNNDEYKHYPIEECIKALKEKYQIP